MYQLVDRYRAWQYKNTALLFLSFVLFFLLLKTAFVSSMLASTGNFGYFGSFLAGIFFVSTFTVAPAVVVLYHLAEIFDPLYVALTAGLGAVLGDYFIFRFFKDYVFDELRPMLKKIGDHPLLRIFSTPYFGWMLPILGAFIIASPFPDEVGIGLMGVSKMKNWQFLLFAFLLNSAGIFFIVTLARSV